MKPLAVEELTNVDPSHISKWIRAIPFSRYPQQHRVDHQLRPAMVNDPGWHDFGKQTDSLVSELLAKLPEGSKAFNRMIGVVMPGHNIPAHYDAQASEWTTRVHVPLQTNSLAFMCFEGIDYHMEYGKAYTVDTRREHSVRNEGTEPRIHFMFDVRR